VGTGAVRFSGPEPTDLSSLLSPLSSLLSPLSSLPPPSLLSLSLLSLSLVSLSVPLAVEKRIELTVAKFFGKK